MTVPGTLRNTRQCQPVLDEVEAAEAPPRWSAITQRYTASDKRRFRELWTEDGVHLLQPP